MWLAVSVPRSRLLTAQELVATIKSHTFVPSTLNPARHSTGFVLPAEMFLHWQPFVASVAALAVGAVFVHAGSLHDSTESRPRRSVYRSQIHSDTNLRYVANSGICETTPGVTQYSGYIDVGTNMSMVSTIR